VTGHRDFVVKTLLHGLTGPIEGRRYPQVMIAMGSNPDRWIADVGSFVRTSFGNGGGLIAAEDVARVRAATRGRIAPWTADEIATSLPRLLVADQTWKVTASHEGKPAPQANADGAFNFQGEAAGVLSFLGWTTGVAQAPGMWIQVELPAVRRLSELQFSSSATGGRGGSPGQWTHPRGYRVQVSLDGRQWSEPIAEGAGAAGTTIVAFAPVDARFVRITQTAAVPDAPAWSMRLLKLFEAPGR
jgi:hypothetical protein